MSKRKYGKKLTIDPGLNGTGWALWDERWKLLRNGVITPKNKGWEMRGSEITCRVLDLDELINDVRDVYMEFPEFHQSAGGQVTAKSGALVKLAWFVGFLSSAIPVPVHYVTPTQWKGQLPKQIVIDRIKAKMPDVKAKSHDYDAIGIGLYVRGDFK